MPDRTDLIEALDTWKQMQRSGALTELFQIFKRHKDYCIKQAMINLDQAKFHQAVQYQARASDMDDLIKLVNVRISGLKKETTENGGM